MRIQKENTTGLVIDIQERLFPVMFGKEAFLKNCVMLIKGLKTLHIPMVVTQQYSKGLGEIVKDIKAEMPECAPIEKREFSCCDSQTVSGKLEELNAKNIIICGIESHVCVLQTSVDLKENGYNPVVVMDCVSSRSEKDLRLAMERFRHEGIMMASAESILFELTRSSEAEEFKTISKLVK